MKNNNTPGILFRKAWFLTDALLFSFILSGSVMLLLRIRFHIAVYCMLLTGTLCLVLLLKRFLDRKRENVKKREKEKEERIERILLLDDAALERSVSEPGFVLIRKLRPDTCDVLNAIRSGAGSIGLLSEDREPYRLIGKYAPEIKILDPETITERVFGPEAEEKTTLPERLLKKRMFNKYFLLGCIFLLLSFIFRYKIYYRLISGMCMILALFTGVFPVSGVWKNLRFFLDKRGDR